VHVLSILTAVAAIAGIGYYVLCLFAAHDYLAYAERKSAAPVFTPSVSILKPLRGADPEMYQAFRSHCLQDYPEYELIFAVSDPADPAAVLVGNLQQEFPDRAIKLVICDRLLGPNGKVSNLVHALAYARFDHFIVNDSDITVPPDYLRRVMAPFADPQVGMVTCLYRGISGKTLGSRLESIGISTDFSAGVLAARMLQGVKFGLGSTLAMRRLDLEQIGGFESLVDYLADDYQLGARIAATGKRVVVSEIVVDHHLPDYTFAEFFVHQMRWARAIRDSRTLDYIGIAATFGVPWALLAVLFSRGTGWGWVLLALTLIMRFALAKVMTSKVLRQPLQSIDYVLIPVRDVIALFVWLASFVGHTIHWRGLKFRLKDGKLYPSGA
jgi:ceramide glucosyltransferase